jgi:hypothetical protein
MDDVSAEDVTSGKLESKIAQVFGGIKPTA